MGSLSDDSQYIRLVYKTVFDDHEREYDYKVYLSGVSSNLGKGVIYYFKCSVINQRCRILYKCYGSDIWKSREAYQNRIYYPSQLSSKLYYYSHRYWAVEDQLKEMYQEVKKSHYRGRKTALQRRIERLEYKQEYYDEMRWRILPKSIQRFIYPAGLQNG